MKRRTLMVSAVVLLLLTLGLREAHNMRAEQKSAEFRRGFLRHAPIGDMGRIATVRVNDSNAGQLGTWEGAELDEALNDIHLIAVPGTGSRVEKSLRGFQITIATSQLGFVDGIYLSTTSDEGFFMLPEENLKGWMLSPASCRAIKRRLWSQYGAKLRALHIPPPQ